MTDFLKLGKGITGALTKARELAKAPQAEALLLAQQRAALPISKGGLGLPPNNTPEQRAAAMGFNKNTYHGSFRDIKKLDPSVGSTESHAGKGVYSTDSPEDASRNYASIYGPDVSGRVERGLEELEKDFRKTHGRMRDEVLTPRQQDILLRNTIGTDNLGVVYPLKVRSDKSVHLDKPEKNETMIGPFQHFDEATDTWTDTQHTPKFNEALDDFREKGGDANPIYEFVQDYGGNDEFPARQLFKVIKKEGDSSGLYDPFTGDIVSGGVAAGDFMKHFGVDEIRHTPQFMNHELNIGKEHTISMNPDNVRSRFAAFDPWRKTAAVAAAMGVAAPDLLAKETEEHKAKGGGVNMSGLKYLQRRYADGGPTVTSQEDFQKQWDATKAMQDQSAAMAQRQALSAALNDYQTNQNVQGLYNLDKGNANTFIADASAGLTPLATGQSPSTQTYTPEAFKTMTGFEQALAAGNNQSTLAGKQNAANALMKEFQGSGDNPLLGQYNQLSGGTILPYQNGVPTSGMAGASATGTSASSTPAVKTDAASLKSIYGIDNPALVNYIASTNGLTDSDLKNLKTVYNAKPTQFILTEQQGDDPLNVRANATVSHDETVKARLADPKSYIYNKGVYDPTKDPKRQAMNLSQYTQDNQYLPLFDTNNTSPSASLDSLKNMYKDQLDVYDDPYGLRHVNTTDGIYTFDKKTGKPVGFNLPSSDYRSQVQQTGTPNNLIDKYGNFVKPALKSANGGVIHMADAGRVAKGALSVFNKAKELAQAKKAAEASKIEEVLASQTAPMTRPQGTGLPLMPREQGMYTPREQKDLPRMVKVDAARAAGVQPKYNERMQDLLDSPKARKKIDKLINQGKELNVQEWYGTEPLRQVAMDAGRTPEQFESLMAQLASASQRNPVDKQNQMGSYLYHLSETGQLPENSLLLTNKLKEALKADPSLAEGRHLVELPTGYGSLAQGDIFNRAVMIGQGNIGEALPPNKKLGTFYENLLGNLKPVTVDVNALRGPIIEQGDPRWLTSKLVEKDEKGNIINSYKPREMYDTGEMTMREAQQRPGFWEAAPSGSEYAGFEDLWQRGAKRHNIEPAEAQALGWYGSADVTALKTKPENYVDNLERLIKRTAEQTGQSPTKVMNDLVTGEGFLRKKGGAVEEPHWHKVFNRKMAEGGYAWVDDKHIPKVRSLKRMAKGGSSDEPTTREIMEAMPQVIKEATSDEAESYKKPRSVSDVIYRGVVANNPISAGVDLMNMGLMGVDAVTGMMGKPTRLASEKPFGGSEHVKDLMDKYGVTSGEQRPISETVLGIMSPTGMVKGAMGAGKAIQKSGTAIKDMVSASPKKARGGLTLMR